VLLLCSSESMIGLQRKEGDSGSSRRLLSAMVGSRTDSILDALDTQRQGISVSTRLRTKLKTVLGLRQGHSAIGLDAEDATVRTGLGNHMGRPQPRAYSSKIGPILFYKHGPDPMRIGALEI